MTATDSSPEHSSQGSQQSADDEPTGGEMSLTGHLTELRTRLVRALAGVVVGFVVGWVLRQQVYDLLVQPLCQLPPELRGGQAGPEGCDLVVLAPLDALYVSIKAAAVVGIIIGAPVVAYQLWRFVGPGLRSAERRYAIPFVLISGVLFLGGAVFSYFIIPIGLEVLLSLAGDSIVPVLDADRYLGFILITMISFGLAFELPLVLILLTLMGVVGSAGLRKYRSYALFGTVVAAAIITPQTDPFSMLLLALPLMAFYESSILVARYIERRRRRAGSAV
jgi:sec-independent protein translocase protein TatC